MGGRRRNGSTACAAERLHLGFLKHLLGVRQGTPNAVVLAETDERPLWSRWLRWAARLWNRCWQPRRTACCDAGQRSHGSTARKTGAQHFSPGPSSWQRPWQQWGVSWTRSTRSLSAGRPSCGGQLNQRCSLALPRLSRLAAAFCRRCQGWQCKQLLTAGRLQGGQVVRPPAWLLLSAPAAECRFRCSNTWSYSRRSGKGCRWCRSPLLHTHAGPTEAVAR